MATALPVLALAAAVTADSFFVWHITDVHVDPYYVENADASACYCETYQSCPRMGTHCVLTPNKTTSARPWGNSEGNCATPTRLYESALDFMAETKVTPFVYFTGDFAEAGASSPCSGSSPAQRQILDVIAYDWQTLKLRLPPPTRVFGSLGNHDSAPGDVFFGMNDGGTGRQSWEYNNLTWLWADDLALADDPAAKATLIRGGYYAVQATKGLTVVSLNINYWVKQNPQAGIPNSTAGQEGARMMQWFAQQLHAAQTRGHAVHVLGHQPPTDGGSAAWLPGYWGEYTALCSKFKDTIRGQFYGHIHIDQWTLTRTCSPPPGPGGPWKETTGIKWCSGGGDFRSGDSFGAGVDGYCPLIPSGWDVDKAVAACTGVCNATNASACVGYTLYFEGATVGSPNSTIPRECCFRTGSTASKPRAPASTARCYEEPGTGAGVCDGPAATALLPGPSLTEGFPATNPSLRLLEFDTATFALLDAHTYTADLHAANAAGGHVAKTLDWKLEYSFRATFGVPDLSAASLERLSGRLAGPAGDTTWEKYRGMGDGCYWVGEYTAKTAPFKPNDPVTVCGSACRASFVSQLNATAFIA